MRRSNIFKKKGSRDRSVVIHITVGDPAYMESVCSERYKLNNADWSLRKLVEAYLHQNWWWKTPIF